MSAQHESWKTDPMGFMCIAAHTTVSCDLLVTSYYICFCIFAWNKLSNCLCYLLFMFLFYRQFFRVGRYYSKTLCNQKLENSSISVSVRALHCPPLVSNPFSGDLVIILSLLRSWFSSGMMRDVKRSHLALSLFMSFSSVCMYEGKSFVSVGKL